MPQMSQLCPFYEQSGMWLDQNLWLCLQACVKSETAVPHWPVYRNPASPPPEKIICIFFWSCCVSRSTSLRKFARYSSTFSLWLHRGPVDALQSALAPWLFLPTAALHFKAWFGLQARPIHICPSQCNRYVGQCCVTLEGGISPPPLSISSHVLRTLVFICLWACHVPEPALISVPRNTVYLPRCCEEGRGGESE